jgi:hypothetical protein
MGLEGTNILNRAVRPFGLYQPFVAVTEHDTECAIIAVSIMRDVITALPLN